MCRIYSPHKFDVHGQVLRETYAAVLYSVLLVLCRRGLLIQTRRIFHLLKVARSHIWRAKKQNICMKMNKRSIRSGQYHRIFFSFFVH